MTTNLHVQAIPTGLRHQFVPEAGPASQAGSIRTIESLRAHLQTAIELEHATIPVYLTALYSIDPETNAFAYRTIQSVVMEEMLHMVQAANILNAIGGSPAINQKAFIPSYPTYLPHSDQSFLISLAKFSKETIDVFLKIELPAKERAPAEGEDYKTIGQFYKAIKHGIRYVNYTTPDGIFTGDKARQVTPEHYYGGGGRLFAVYSIADALLGINEIVGQGEGVDGSIRDADGKLFGDEIEYAHYFKFNEIHCERRYQEDDAAGDPPTGREVAINWAAAANLRPNPKMSEYPPGSPLYQKTLEFNQTYMRLLDGIHQACNGQPEKLRAAIPLMYDLKYKARELMNIPLGDGRMAGPSFEYVELG